MTLSRDWLVYLGTLLIIAVVPLIGDAIRMMRRK